MDLWPIVYCPLPKGSGSPHFCTIFNYTLRKFHYLSTMGTPEERLGALEQALLGERAARQQAEARTAQLETRLIDQAQMSQLMRDGVNQQSLKVIEQSGEISQ